MSKFTEESERYHIASSVQSGESILINGTKHMIIGAYQFAVTGNIDDNFTEGEDSGIVQIDSFRIGIRICYEVRFPEYFRELYRQQTDLNLILFYDAADHEDPDRYAIFKGHIHTRAVENVCPVLACNSCSQFQTAPTILFDRSGKILAEMQKEKEGLLSFDLEQNDLTFGEQGRKELSDSLTK